METEPAGPEASFGDVTIVVDASNVCWGRALADRGLESKGHTRPPMRGLVLCVNYFEAYRTRGSKLVAVAPSWWDHASHMDTEDQEAFEALKTAGLMQIAPPGVHDDLVILGCALTEGRIMIVTNDKFRDHQASLGLQVDWYESRRVGFEFVNDTFIPDARRLERILGDTSLLGTESTFALPTHWDATEDATRQHSVQVFHDSCAIDPSLAGIMIGKGGARIKQIETRFGTSIKLRDGLVTVSGLSPEHVFWAKIAFCSVRPYVPANFKVPAIPAVVPMELEDSVNVKQGEVKLARPDVLKKRVDTTSPLSEPSVVGLEDVTPSKSADNNNVNLTSGTYTPWPRPERTSVRIASQDTLRSTHYGVTKPTSDYALSEVAVRSISKSFTPSVKLASSDTLGKTMDSAHNYSRNFTDCMVNRTVSDDHSAAMDRQISSFSNIRLAAPDTLGCTENGATPGAIGSSLDRTCGSDRGSSETSKRLPIEQPPICVQSSIQRRPSSVRRTTGTPIIAAPDLRRGKSERDNT